MSIDYINLLPQGYIQEPLRGPVYSAAPEEADDLTQIHGIGEVLEAQLNLNGVYRLEQIALWNQTNIEAFSSLMPCFQDRIERNYWILQAQRIIERREASRPAAAAVSGGFPAGLIQTVLMLAIALLVGLLFVQWLDGGTPKTYAGILRARTFHIVATKTGTVSEMSVAEGEQVLEGQEIATLHDNALDDSRRRQAALVASLQKNVDEARAKSELDLRWRLHELNREILEHRQAIAIANEPAQSHELAPLPSVIDTSVPTKTASFSKRRPRMLYFPATNPQKKSDSRGVPAIRATQSTDVWSDEPASSPQQHDEDPFGDDAGGSNSGGLQTVLEPPKLIQISGTQIRTISSVERVKLAEDRIRELNSLKESLKGSIERAGGVAAAEASLSAATAELESLNTTEQEVVMTTSGFGVISEVLCQAGDKVQMGQPVLEVIDCRNQYVSALVPSRHVDSITPGMKVSLYFPGNQHRRGRINSLPVRTTERDNGGEPMLEIRIEPMGGLWPAVPMGSQVRVAVD